MIPKTSTLPPYPDYANPNQQEYWQSSQDFDIGMTVFQGEQNSVIDGMNSTATAIDKSAASASESASESATSALQAKGSANFQGDWTSNTQYNVGVSVYHNSAFYVCRENNSDLVFDDTKWLVNVPLGAIGNTTSPLLDLPLLNNLVPKASVGGESDVLFVRDGNATYTDRYGDLQTALGDEPRFEKDGLLVEGASTNIVTYSEFNGGYPVGGSGDWANTPQVVNGVNMDKFTKDSVGYKDYTVLGTNFSASTFIYDDGLSIGEDIVFRSSARGDSIASIELMFDYDGKVFSASLFNDGWNWNVDTLIDGVYRINTWYTGDVTNITSCRIALYNDLFWSGGYQLEQLPFSTSYIPTVDTAVTRNADYLSVTPYGNIPNAMMDRTVSLSILPTGYDSSNGLYTLKVDGLSIEQRTAGNYRFKSNDNTQDTNDWTLGLKEKFAFTSDNVNSSLYANGVLLSTTATDPYTTADATILNIGWLGSPDRNFYGYITELKLYDKVLSATEIALLS